MGHMNTSKNNDGTTTVYITDLFSTDRFAAETNVLRLREILNDFLILDVRLGGISPGGMAVEVVVDEHDEEAAIDHVLNALAQELLLAQR